MPKEGISVFFTIKDGASQVLKTIGDHTKALDKETQALAQSQAALKKANEPLIKTQQELKERLEQVSRQVADNRKEWKKYDSELARDSMNDAIAEQDQLKRRLKDVGDQIANNEKEYRRMRETIRKGEIAASGGGDPTDSLVGGLARAGVLTSLASSFGGLANSVFASGVGVPEASVISNTLGGIASGAAMGSAIPGIGTIAGAVLGGVSGLISAGTQIFEDRDDAFKEYYKSGIEDAYGGQEARISGGSSIAGSREQNRIAFAKRLGGDAAAEKFLSQVQAEAASTNYSYDEIIGYAKQLLNSYSTEGTLSVLHSLSDATAALDLSSSDVNMMIAGLSRMRTTGKTTQEYLNYFSERGVDVYSALAGSEAAPEADRSQIAEMVSKGQIDGVAAAEAILTFIDEKFGGLSNKLMNTYDAMVDNLADAEANLQSRAGLGYNEERKKGIAAQQDWLEKNGGEMGDAYAMIGEWQASLENTKERLEREALSSVMTGDISGDYADSTQRDRLAEMAAEYQEAMKDQDAGIEGAGARMGALLAEAQIIAMNEYNASEGAQLALEAELSLAAQIRDNTESNKAFWDAGYRKSHEYSKGLATGFWNTLGMANAAIVDDSEYDPNTLAGASSRAMGQGTVPYDGFPALLHQGERVLTASEARAQDRGGVNVSIGSVTVGGGAGELDTWAIATAIAQELERAAVAAAPQ